MASRFGSVDKEHFYPCGDMSQTVPWKGGCPRWNTQGIVVRQGGGRGLGGVPAGIPGLGHPWWRDPIPSGDDASPMAVRGPFRGGWGRGGEEVVLPEWGTDAALRGQARRSSREPPPSWGPCPLGGEAEPWLGLWGPAILHPTTVSLWGGPSSGGPRSARGGDGHGLATGP